MKLRTLALKIENLRRDRIGFKRFHKVGSIVSKKPETLPDGHADKPEPALKVRIPEIAS